MSRKNIIFDDKKINKSNFYKNKKLVFVHSIKIVNLSLSELKTIA